MKHAIAAVLISSTVSSIFLISALLPVLADEISLDSKVVEVTVYPRGAEVTRMALAEVQDGDHVIIVDDLPGQVVANSVRVEGNSDARLEIGSVDVRQLYVVGEDHSGKRVEIEDAIEALNDEIAALGQEINNANSQRAILQALAAQAVLPRKAEGSGVVISADELDSLLSLVGERFAEISKITGRAGIRQRELSRKIEELRLRLDELAPKQQLKTVIAINLTASGSGEAEFRIRYNVKKAGWAPVYDAKLSLGTAGKDSLVKIVRRANVRQATTETWDNVALTLSTARPRGNTQVPQLSPYVLSEYQQFLSKRDSEMRQSVQEMAPEAPVAEDQVALGRAMKPKKKAGFKQVAVEFAGFLAQYRISGLVSVTNAGAKKNVTIGAKELPAKISAHSVPKIDPSAYLTAQFTVEGKSPWLPGTVMLSRNGVFLGKARLPLLNPGEEHSLGFGRDDFVKIERVLVTDKKGESGFISTVNVEERKFVTTISNLHDFPMRVIVQDQLPYGTHEDIEVEMMADTTRPDKTDVDKKRGVLAWEYVIQPKAEKIIDFGYKVSWPKDMNITPVR